MVTKQRKGSKRIVFCLKMKFSKKIIKRKNLTLLGINQKLKSFFIIYNYIKNKSCFLTPYKLTQIE